MATARSKLSSAENTLLLWQAIEAEYGSELQGSNRVELIGRLVEQGADVNAVRADGFTPLLVAVFFGRLDVVKLLVEHGADLTACSRFETSAEMWAQARGFQEIIEYLHDCRNKPTYRQPSQSTIPTASFKRVEPDDESVVPELVSANVLRDPPEIWDLVHENRNSFNPRAAFLSHVGSAKARIALLTLLILVIGGAIGFATMGLRGGTSASAVKSVVPRKPDATVQPEAVIPTPSTIEEQPIPASRQNRRTRQSASTRSSRRDIANDISANNVPTKTETKPVQPVQTVTVTATLDAEVTARKTPNTNNKLIQNSSAAQPRKPRVIQWP